MQLKTNTIPLFFVFLMSVEVSNLQVPEKAGITWMPGGTGDTGDDGCAGSGSSCQRIKAPRGTKQCTFQARREGVTIYPDVLLF